MHAGVQSRYKSWLAWWTHGVTAHVLCDSPNVSKTQTFHCHDRWTIQVHRLMKRIKRSEAGRMQCEWQQAWPTLPNQFWDWAMAAAAGLDVHLHPLDLASTRRILQQFGYSVFVFAFCFWQGSHQHFWPCCSFSKCKAVAAWVTQAVSSEQTDLERMIWYSKHSSKCPFYLKHDPMNIDVWICLLYVWIILHHFV